MSPNADFVPEPNIGLVQVYVCKDYICGIHDPFQWPQVFSEGYEYLCAVPRRHNLKQPLYACMWDTPYEDRDFRLLEGVVFNCLGLVSPMWFSLINTLVDQITHEVDAFM